MEINKVYNNQYKILSYDSDNKIALINNINDSINPYIVCKDISINDDTIKWDDSKYFNTKNEAKCYMQAKVLESYSITDAMFLISYINDEGLLYNLKKATLKEISKRFIKEYAKDNNLNYSDRIIDSLLDIAYTTYLNDDTNQDYQSIAEDLCMNILNKDKQNEDIESLSNNNLIDIANEINSFNSDDLNIDIDIDVKNIDEEIMDE